MLVCLWRLSSGISQKQTGLKLMYSLRQRLPLPEINIVPGSLTTIPSCAHCPSVLPRRILASRSQRASSLSRWPTKWVSQGDVYSTMSSLHHFLGNESDLVSYTPRAQHRPEQRYETGKKDG